MTVDAAATGSSSNDGRAFSRNRLTWQHHAVLPVVVHALTTLFCVLFRASPPAVSEFTLLSKISLPTKIVP